MVKTLRNLLFVPMLLIAAGMAWGDSSGSVLAEKATADRIIVEKSARRLTLMREGRPLKSYRIALGQEPVGKKERRGDRKTPEGVYEIDSRNDRSRFYRALHISYPNADDLYQAQKLGVSTGGDIMIHGLPNGLGPAGDFHRVSDWTSGCIALTNEEMDELWQAVPDGTIIEIRR